MMNDPLPATPRMPVLFIGHGSPMNAIEDNEFRRSWESLGRQFGSRWPRPALILCVSAHWLTHGWWVTGMDKPKTIHDFGGFPRELFEQQYPAPGAPEAAREIAQALGGGVDVSEWGLDHGAWSVLKPMFPAADIPVVQLSMDYGRPPQEHFAIGEKLRPFRERGVLVVASGNTVHNLRAMRRDVAANQAYDWTVEFDKWVAERIASGELAQLADFRGRGQAAQLAQPTHDHYLPLLYAAGAADPDDEASFFNDSYQAASIAMRSVVWS